MIFDPLQINIDAIQIGMEQWKFFDFLRNINKNILTPFAFSYQMMITCEQYQEDNDERYIPGHREQNESQTERP